MTRLAPRFPTARATLAALALVLAAPSVHAAATIRVPAGWSAVERGPARARTAQWFAGRDDVHVLEVYTPDATDRFAEIIARVELTGAYDVNSTDEAELRRALGSLPGFDPATAVWSRDDLGGAPRLHATWQHEGVLHRAELVASGTTRTLLMQAALVSEAPLYSRTFDAVAASLEGAAAPMVPFERTPWRLRAMAWWLAGVGAVLGVALWRRPLGASARTIGRAVALGCMVAALVAGWTTAAAFAGHTEALKLAGVTAETLAYEVAAYGLIAAMLAWAIGTWLAGREGPVASAPLRGSFADRSSGPLPSVPMIPQVPRKPEAKRPRHPDGPSRLEQVAPDGGAPPAEHTAD